MLVFTLHSTSGELLTLPDPSGGDFDAAGDFDDVISRFASDVPVLASLDPYSSGVLTAEQASRVVAEVDVLLKRIGERVADEQRPGQTRRGLRRLQEMALYASTQRGASLGWTGD